MVEYVKLKHKVIEAGAGVEIFLDEFVFKASTPGKKVYIQSGLHGGETSQWVLHQLAEYLMKNLQKGEVHIVPYANPMAWMQRSYFSTFGKYSLIDGKDYNRCFTENTNNDINGKICDAIMKLAKEADFVIDLHTSKSSNVFGIYTKREYEQYIKLLGVKYNQYSDDAAISSLHGTFNAALDRAKIANVTIECGGHNELDADKVLLVYNGIVNLLKSFDMLNEKPQTTEEVFSFEKRVKLFADCSGLIAFNKKIGEKVIDGETIANIYPANDLLVIKNVVASQSGILQVSVPGHIVWEGDVVAEIIPTDDIKKI